MKLLELLPCGAIVSRRRTEAVCAHCRGRGKACSCCGGRRVHIMPRRSAGTRARQRGETKRRPERTWRPPRSSDSI